ncbi:hypothetical protein Fmac_008067 [Flemingia macrophylla]|uniref:Uncharacterized protein n=1 Tax=Flemingia macrophylla TaxID=520843 RepID=A0ABD1MX83_9FABA
MAHSYLIFFFPELLIHSFLHPIRIYFQVQGVTHLVTLADLPPLPFQLRHSHSSRPRDRRRCSRLQLLHIAIHSSVGSRCCVSICLEWRWYEIMIVLCGLLAHPTATVASMGILIQTTSLIYVFFSSLSFAVLIHVGMSSVPIVLLVPGCRWSLVFSSP